MKNAAGCRPRSRIMTTGVCVNVPQHDDDDNNNNHGQDDVPFHFIPYIKGNLSLIIPV